MRLLIGSIVSGLLLAGALAQECGPGCTSCDKSAQPRVDVIKTGAGLKALKGHAPQVDFHTQVVLVIHAGKAPGGSSIRFDGLATDKGVTYALATVVKGDESGTVEPTCTAVVPKDHAKSLCLVTARVDESKAEGEGGEPDGGPPQSNSGPFSAITKERVAVIRTQAELAALWADHNGHKSGAPATPVVDFDSNVLVAYFAGDMPRGGVKVVLRPYADAAGVSHVFVTQEHFGRGDDTGIHTQPFAFVEVPRSPAVRVHPPAARLGVN